MKRFNKHFKFLALLVGVVLVWRGMWGLTDIYFLPNHPELSLLLSIIVGLAILFSIDRKLEELL